MKTKLLLTLSLLASPLVNASTWVDKLTPAYQGYVEQQIQESLANVSHYQSLPEKQLRYDAEGYRENVLLLVKSNVVYLLGLVGPRVVAQTIGVTHAGSFFLRATGSWMRFSGTLMGYWAAIQLVRKSMSGDGSNFSPSLVVRDGHELALELTESPLGYERVIEMSKTPEGYLTLHDLAFQSPPFYDFLIKFGHPKFDWKANASQP